MNRVRKYVFDVKFLHSGVFNKVLLAQMVKQLPSDFSIVGWGTEYCRMCSYFIIKSSTFDKVPEYQMIPEHSLTFTR